LGEASFTPCSVLFLSLLDRAGLSRRGFQSLPHQFSAALKNAIDFSSANGTTKRRDLSDMAVLAVSERLRT